MTCAPAPEVSLALAQTRGGFAAARLRFQIHHLLLNTCHPSRYTSYFDRRLRLVGNNFIPLIFRNRLTGSTYHKSSGTMYATSTSISFKLYAFLCSFPCA